MKLVPLVPSRSRVLTMRRYYHSPDIPEWLTRYLSGGPVRGRFIRSAPGWLAVARVGHLVVKARSTCGLVGFGPVRFPEGGPVIAWRARVWRAGVLIWLDHERHARKAPGVIVTRSRPWVRVQREGQPMPGYGQRADVEHDGGSTGYAHLRQERPGAAAHLGGKA